MPGSLPTRRGRTPGLDQAADFGARLAELALILTARFGSFLPPSELVFGICSRPAG